MLLSISLLNKIIEGDIDAIKTVNSDLLYNNFIKGCNVYFRYIFTTVRLISYDQNSTHNGTICTAAPLPAPFLPLNILF